MAFIFGTLGNDTLEIYGTVDLSTSIFYNDIESLVVHSDITLDADTLSLAPIGSIAGEGEVYVENSKVASGILSFGG